MRPILLDCDPGIDDALAIILALNSPELEIAAITTATGNLPADRTNANARKILELVQRPDIPVAMGLMRPIIQDYPQDPFSHGQDGLGNTDLPEPHLPPDPRPATILMREVIQARPGEITLVATAPLTNLAMLVLEEPALVSQIKEVILIGGSFGFNQYGLMHGTGGNPVSEWNIFVDPDAAKIVFHSGIPLTAIGLDVVTHPDINLRPRHLEALRRSRTPGAWYLQQILQFLESRHFQSYCALIDSLAVAAAADPSLIQTEEIHVEIETDSPLTRGQTVTDHRSRFRWEHLPVIRAACGADYDRFLDRLITTITENSG